MAEVTLAIVAHAVLGVVLAAGAWSSGFAFVQRGHAVSAYPFGLLALTAAATLVLVSSWLAPLALALLVLSLVRGVGRLPARALAHVSLPAIGLGTALGLVNHGPTEDVDSSAYGDMLFYAAKVVSAAQSIVPFRDLLVAGERHVYVESAWMLISGALEPGYGVDPILLQAATAPAFFLTALALGFALLRRPAPPVAALISVLVIGAVAYPTWLTESPPVALAAPLAFTLYGIWRDALTLPFLLAVGAATASGFFLTKALGLVPLAIVGTVAIVRDHRAGARALLATAGAAALATVTLFAVDSAWLVDVFGTKFLPSDAVRGLRRQLEVRDTQAASTAILMIGQVLFAAVLARRRAWTLLGVLGAAICGGWLLGGHGFYIVLTLAILLGACLLADEGVDDPLLLASTAALLAAAAWFRDITGLRAALFPLATVFVGVLLALAPRPRPAVAIGAVAVLAAGLLAFSSADRATTLTPADREIWARVHRQVPADGLVFTSETGPVIASDQGWNYYPGVWGRQLYLGGWTNSQLLVDDEARELRLSRNELILEGRIHPRALELDRAYASYYAVVDTGSPVPPTFRRLAGNRKLTIYRIP